MRKFMLALALVLACQLGADENEWKRDFYRVIDAEHVIFDHLYIHPNRKIVLCLIYPSEHYVSYKVRVNDAGDRVLGCIHLKYKEAKKFFPWIKMFKKAYLDPLKGHRFKIKRENPPEPTKLEIVQEPTEVFDDSPRSDDSCDQPDFDLDS